MDASTMADGSFGFADGERWLDDLRDAERPPDLGQLAGWDLLEEVDRGGQGVVWKARRRADGRIGALKRPLLGALAGARTRRRFEREIDAASGLDHPGIVKVIGLEHVGGQPVLALEWVEGERIDAWAERHHHRPADILRQFLDVCDAVAHAHQRGVIHRDLKPSNVLVDSDGFPRVLDFGLAKLVDDDASFATRSAELLGTPAYAAPEQLAGNAARADARSDVYALCVLLQQMLTGALPYDVSGPLPQVVDTVLHTPPRRPSDVRPGLSRELDLIILKGLSKEAEERYPTVDSLGEDIRRHLQGDAILAHPPSTWYHVRKLVSRHRAACAVTVAFVIMVATFAIVTAVQATRIATQRDAARLARDDARAEATRVRRLLSMLTRDVFHALRPEVHGPDVSLVTSLETLAATAGSDVLANDPALVTEIRLLLTDAFNALGRFRDASEHAAAALALTEGTDELLPGSRGRCHLALGRALIERGRLAEALEHLEHPDADRAAQQDEETRKGLMLARAEALGQIGRLADAEAALLATLDRPLEDEAATDAEIPTTLHAFASLRMRQGRPDEADRMSQRALAAAARAHGDDHVMTAGAHTTRGTLLASLGRYEEARRHHERALELRRAALGADHPHQIANLVSLAHLAIAVGEPRRAGEFLDRASAIDARGENGQSPTSIESARAALLVEQGEIDSALALQVRILDAAERQFGDQSAVVANVLANLGPTLWDAGHTAEGRACTERSVALRRRHLGPGHPDVAHSLNALAVICAREGDAQGAARHYADAMEILDRHWTDPHPYRLRLRLNLAGAKVRLAAGEEAVPLLGEALAMAHDLGQTVANDADCRDSHALLTRTLADLKRWPEALEAARAWADACRSDLGESNPDRAQAELFEARLLAKTGRQEEGARRLIRLYERVKRLDGEGGEGTRGFARHLAELYDGWGRADEAARWRALAKPRDSH